jgi:dienelactone hydrolase
MSRPPRFATAFAAALGSCVVLGLAAPAAAAAPVAATPAAAALGLPVSTYAVTLPSGDPADVYHPDVPAALRGVLADAFPVVAVLQGANVDKRYYGAVGRVLARQGFVVVVPNHLRAPGGPLPPGLFTSPTVVPNVLAAAEAEDDRPGSPIAGIVDTDRLSVVGHSFGGAVALFAAADVCEPPLCDGAYRRPAELTAVAAYGTNLATGSRLDRDLDTSGVAVALVQGTLDGIAPPAEAEVTYPSLEQPRALITIAGANHYGITDVDDPPGAVPDPNGPTLPQERATALVGRWSGLWLRAQLRRDPVARALIYLLHGSVDGVVQVRTD